MKLLTAVFFAVCTMVANGAGSKELHIGLLFPSRWETSIACAVAAIDEINDREDILSGHTLKHHFIDTKGGSALQGFASRNLIENMLNTTFVGIIGAGFSDITAITAQITSDYNVIQISPTSSSPVLSDQRLYPYFFRTTPTDISYIPFLNQLLKEEEWNTLALLHFEDEPHQSFASDFANQLKGTNTSIVFSSGFEEGDHKSVVGRLKDSGARIIVMASWDSHNIRILCEAFKAGLTGPQYVWILVSQSGRHSWWSYVTYYTSRLENQGCTPAEVIKAMEDNLQLFYLDDLSLHTDKYEDYKAINGETPLQIWNERFRETYQKLWNKTSTGSFSLSMLRSYDAVWALALGLNATQSAIPKSWDKFTYNDQSMTDLLKHEIDSNHFSGATGHLAFRDGSGDRLAEMELQQFKNGSVDIIALYDEENISFEWLKTQEVIWKKNGGRPPRDSVKTVEIKKDADEITQYVFYGLGAFAVFQCLVLLLMMLFCYSKRTIQFSWPLMNTLTVLGCLAIVALVILNGFERPQIELEMAEIFCEVSTFLAVLGFTFTYGAMAAKTYGVYHFFSREPREKDSSMMKVPEWRPLGILFVFILVDAAVLVCWQIFDPVAIKRELLQEEVLKPGEQIIESYYHDVCTSQYMIYWATGLYCYKSVVLAFGAFMIWPAWVVAARRKSCDIYYVGIAMIYDLVIVVASVVVLYVFADDKHLTYKILGGAFLSAVIVTVSQLLYPKIYDLCNDDEDERNDLAGCFVFMKNVNVSPRSKYNDDSLAMSTGAKNGGQFQDVDLSDE